MHAPSDLSAYWKHLRLPFQLSLAPLFLWGYLLASRPLSSAFVLAFLSLHFGLYAGITAFNSAYDRDEGPVGGMFAPPPVPSRLLAFSLAVQTFGALLAFAVGPSFLAVYLTIALLGATYSWPRTRWKAHPIASAATVFIGQGALGFLAGWVAARGGVGGIGTERGVLGMLSAAFTTLGLYPLTQVYQIVEDRKRGDRTLAVVLGPTHALMFGGGCLLIAALAAVTVMARTSSRLDAVLMACGYVVLLWQMARFTRAYSRQPLSIAGAFRAAMRLNFLAAAGFLVCIALHLACRR